MGRLIAPRLPTWHAWQPPADDEATDRSPLERLLVAIESHIAGEADSLEAYRCLADDSADPVIRLLMQLIVEDEERHHQLLERMAASLRSCMEWSSAPTALPSSKAGCDQGLAEEIAVTQAFIREERDGARELRQLARAESHLSDGLFSLLLESMALDSEKHELLLRFILARLKDREHLAR